MQTEYYDGRKETVLLDEQEVPAAVAAALADATVKRVTVKRLTAKQKRQAKREAYAALAEEGMT